MNKVPNSEVGRNEVGPFVMRFDLAHAILRDASPYIFVHRIERLLQVLDCRDLFNSDAFAAQEIRDFFDGSSVEALGTSGSDARHNFDGASQVFFWVRTEARKWSLV